MEKSTSTDDKLSIITDRNDGKRKSLAFDDEYNDSQTDSTFPNSDSSPSPFEPIDKDKSDIPLVPHDAIGTSADKVKLRQRHPKTEKAEGQVDKKSIESNDYKHIVNKFNQIKLQTNARLNKRPKPDDDSKYKSRFGDIKFYSHLTTIFDAGYFKHSQFFGIYVLFWLGTAFLLLNSLVRSYFENHTWFYNSPVVNTMKKDILKIGLTDLGMYLTTYFALFIQYACLKEWISWDNSGWIIQLVYDFVHLAFWLLFASDVVMGYTWIGKVFLVLHNFVFLMKMHSYAFYNGYLWKVLDELKFSEKTLDRINRGETNLSGEKIAPTKEVLLDSVAFCKFELEYQSIATTMSRDVTVDPKDVEDDIDELQKKDLVKFPQNINLFNFFEYSMFPTVVYTLNFPRTPRIRKNYLFEKLTGIFGIIFLMILVAQNWLYPLVLKCIALRPLPVDEKFREYFFILLDMMPPFLLIYLLTFFLIWDAILNTIAELSRFADRDFYGPWWSCTDWSEYSRIWNRPVYKFLLRHVYHSSISALKVNRMQATLLTFIISSLVHELVMFVIFGTLRGYLLILQMSQIPLVMISKTKYMRDKKVLGNVICWFGFISGPSMICTLYLIF